MIRKKQFQRAEIRIEEENFVENNFNKFNEFLINLFFTRTARLCVNLFRAALNGFRNKGQRDERRTVSVKKKRISKISTGSVN